VRKVFEYVSAFFNFFIDLFYRDPIERSIMNVVGQKPIFPGQRWLLPRIGEVVIESDDDDQVCYRVISLEPYDEFSDGTYRTSRKNFLLWCRDPRELIDFSEDDTDDTDDPPSEESDNIIQLNPRNPQ